MAAAADSDGGAARRAARLEAGQSANLDAKAWVEAAFDALAEGGIEAVRVEPLAKQLKVTRGSFYWHFEDRAALHQAMLSEWRKGATLMVYRRLERSEEAVADRLKRLLELPLSSPRSARAFKIELAIRLWAQRDRRAADAVAAIDRRRLHYFATLFIEHGVPKAQARGRAFLFYSSLFAQSMIAVDRMDELVAACAEMLIGTQPAG